MAAPLTLRNRTAFSGSFTDNIFSNDPMLCAKNDNLVLDNNDKLVLRPGSQIVYTAVPQPLSLSARIARAFKLSDESVLFGVTSSHLWYMTGSTFTEITGAHDALTSGVAASKVSYSEWRDHMFVTDDQGSPVVKVYNDGSWRVRTAGLPAPDGTQYISSSATALTNAIALANGLRTGMKAHFTDVTQGTTPFPATAQLPMHKASDTVSDGLVAAAASDLATLLALTTSLLKAYNNHYLDTQKASTYHQREVPDAEWVDGEFITTVNQVACQTSLSAPVLESVSAPTTLIEAIARLNDLKKCYNSHDGMSDIHGGELLIYSATPSYLAVNFGQHQVTTSFVFDFCQGPLIPLDRQKIYDMANLLTSKLQTHFTATTKQGKHAVSDAADAANLAAFGTVTTPETLPYVLLGMLTGYYEHNFDAEIPTPGPWTYHSDENTVSHSMPNPPVSGLDGNIADYRCGVSPGNWTDALTKLNSLRTYYNAHVNDHKSHLFNSGGDSGPLKHLAAGSDLTLANYLYAFVHKYSYTINGTTFVDRSSPLLATGLGVIPTNYAPMSITGIPTLANTAATNYDTSNIVIEIYRTTNNGTTYYYVGEVTNGTTTFTDRVSDTDLQLNEPLYTTGGVLANDAPPKAKCLHIVNNKCYYGNVTTSASEILPRRVMESIANDPDSVPAANYLDLDDDVVGITSSKSVPLVFCKHSFVRLEGGFDELGRGALTSTVVSDTVGLVSENSIVKTDAGIFFAGTDGFYFTDGYAYRKLSGDWNTTYQSLISTTTKQKRISGSYDPLTRRIWWTVQQGASASENDACFILDLNYSFDPHPTWTTATGATFTPTALCWFGGILYRGDTNSFFYKHSTSLLTDPYYTSLTGAANWGTSPIVYDFQSCFEDFGQPEIRKWCTWLVWDMERDTNVDMQPQSRNNDYDAWQSLGAFSYLSDWVWGDTTLIWGTPTYIWNSSRGIAGQKRRFPSNQIRCAYKQIRFTNKTVLIKDSADTGTATAAGAGNTLTLDTVGKTWLTDPVGYTIYLSHDNYTEGFTIVRRNSSTVLTVLDPNGTVPSTAGLSWKIYGTPKSQQFHMLEYAVLGAPQSRSQQASRPATAADV